MLEKDHTYYVPHHHYNIHQIRAIASKDGLIGMNACCSFIHTEQQKQDALHLAKHAKYVADLVGVKHVACGFDFGEYYNDGEEHNMYGPSQAQNFIKALQRVGFTNEEIKDIAYRKCSTLLKKIHVKRKALVHLAQELYYFQRMSG